MLGYVVVVLLQDVISKGREIIISPTADKPYNKLCDKITACGTVPTHKYIAQLLEQETISDSTPSQFLKQVTKNWWRVQLNTGPVYTGDNGAGRIYTNWAVVFHSRPYS